jgi:DNA-binding MarR family transcriptional regulator
VTVTPSSPHPPAAHLPAQNTVGPRRGADRATAEPWLANDVAAAARRRDGRTNELAGEVVEAARLLVQAAGARQPAAAPAAFASLRPRQVQLLRLLACRPGSSVRAAAEAVGMRPHNVSTLVTELVAAGLVDRRGDPRDRRVARLFLSEEARAQIEDADAGLHSAVVDALARLTDVDQGRIRTALPALHRLVSRLAAGG